MAVDIAYDVPVIGAEAFRRIIGKPAFGFAVDGDAVVIVKPISLPSPSVPASEQASWEIPSIKQPSPMNTRCDGQ